MSNYVVNLVSIWMCKTRTFAHLAPTYAAINPLVILQSTEAYKIIEYGALALHIGGEVDVTCSSNILCPGCG